MRGEDVGYFNVFRIYQVDQIFYDYVYVVFVKGIVIVEIEQIKFEVFIFYYFYIGQVVDMYFCKIWLFGYGVQVGKFWIVEMYLVIIFRMFVIEGF